MIIKMKTQSYRPHILLRKHPHIDPSVYSRPQNCWVRSFLLQLVNLLYLGQILKMTKEKAKKPKTKQPG